MSQKRAASDREWLAAVTIAAVGLPAAFYFLWHAFDGWPQALLCTCIGAAGIRTAWERRFTTPNRPRGHRCRR